MQDFGHTDPPFADRQLSVTECNKLAQSRGSRGMGGIHRARCDRCRYPMGPHSVNTTPSISGHLKSVTPWRCVAGLFLVWLRQRPSDRPCSLAMHPVVRSLSLSGKLAALFGGALLTLFATSLIVEDQRRFVACRASGASTDACLLQINGR